MSDSETQQKNVLTTLAVAISALLFENSKPDQALRYALANGEVLLSLKL